MRETLSWGSVFSPSRVYPGDKRPEGWMHGTALVVHGAGMRRWMLDASGGWDGPAPLPSPTGCYGQDIAPSPGLAPGGDGCHHLW